MAKMTLAAAFRAVEAELAAIMTEFRCDRETAVEILAWSSGEGEPDVVPTEPTPEFTASVEGGV